MGKRSDFARRERDTYDTPAAPVQHLKPHLPPRFVFIEPFAGKAALVGHLERMGGACLWASDIAPRSAEVHTLDWADVPEVSIADFVITNPPWTRSILHPFLDQCISRGVPAWLLFDAGWAYTLQAAPYLAHCRKIAAAGRVKWIEGSAHASKDDCAWYLFEKESGPPVLIGRSP